MNLVADNLMFNYITCSVPMDVVIESESVSVTSEVALTEEQPQPTPTSIEVNFW